MNFNWETGAIDTMLRTMLRCVRTSEGGELLGNTDSRLGLR